MNKKYLDFDGVLVDSVSVCCRVAEIIRLLPEGTYDASKIKLWDMHDIIDGSNEILMNQIFDSELFWEIAEDYIYEGAKEFIDKYRETCCIVSIGTLSNQINKLSFIQKHFGNVDCLPVVTDISHPLTIDKSYIKMGNGDVLIEDSYRNILKCTAEYNILFNSYGNWGAQWSHDWDADKTQQYYEYTDRAINWDEVSKIVEWIDKDRFISSY